MSFELFAGPNSKFLSLSLIFLYLDTGSLYVLFLFYWLGFWYDEDFVRGGGRFILFIFIKFNIQIDEFKEY